jgi:hypothetical protein
MHGTWLSASVAVLFVLRAASTTLTAGRNLRHEEQSVVVLREAPVAEVAGPGRAGTKVAAAEPSDHNWRGPGRAGAKAAAAEPSDHNWRVPPAIEKESLAIGALLQSEAEVVLPDDKKAQLRKKLVALIWLEKVLQQNLDSLDDEAFRSRISQVKAQLAKDSTPGTADMLSGMRTEMHEFSAPFFETVVREELTQVRAKQKAVLLEIAALDDGGNEPAVLTPSEDVTAEKAPPKQTSSPSSSAWTTSSTWLALMFVMGFVVFAIITFLVVRSWSC